MAFIIILYTSYNLILPVTSSNISFAAFYTAAQLFANKPESLPAIYDNEWYGQQIHQHGFPEINDIYNLNPPTMGVMLLPLGLFSIEAGRHLWVWGNFAIFVLGIWLLQKALLIPGRWVGVLLAILLLTTPVRQHIIRNQLYFILFCLLCGLVWAWLHQQKRWAGLALACMISFKTAGVWFFLQCFLRREWRMIGWTGGAIVLITLVSLPITGIAVWLRYFSLLPGLATDPIRYVTAYQTLTSLFGHLFVYDVVWNPAPFWSLPLLGSLLSTLIFVCSLALSVRVLLPPQATLSQRALHIAMQLALLVTNAPFAEDYHYVLILPSLLIAWWWSLQWQPTWTWWVSLAAATFALMAPLPYKYPFFMNGIWAIFAYPRVYGAYLLWGWLFFKLDREYGITQRTYRTE